MNFISIFKELKILIIFLLLVVLSGFNCSSQRNPHSDTPLIDLSSDSSDNVDPGVPQEPAQKSQKNRPANKDPHMYDPVTGLNDLGYDKKGDGTDRFNSEGGAQEGHDKTRHFRGEIEPDADDEYGNMFAIDENQAVHQFLADIPNLQTALEYFNANEADISPEEIGRIIDPANEAFYAIGTHPPAIAGFSRKITQIAKRLFVRTLYPNDDADERDTLLRHHTILTIYGYGNAGLSAREAGLQKRLTHQ